MILPKRLREIDPDSRRDEIEFDLKLNLKKPLRLAGLRKETSKVLEKDYQSNLQKIINLGFTL